MINDQKSTLPENCPSPRELLKQRRPEQFSDSRSRGERLLNRTILEYHLDTLTNRNQETEFERFALSIAKRTICPNLRGQTGPMGGGDAKVDSETFPIDEQLALGWTVGTPSHAPYERWALAFSTKADWQPKAKSDIGKISSTNRGYTKAFFISSRYIPDKKRSKQEDVLTQAHGIEVKIFDRTWLLDQVFDRHLEAVAIEILQIEIPSTEQYIEGIQDRSKREVLEEIESQIQEALQASKLNMQLTQNCLKAARLARELERPRTEVDGHFERAIRIATKYGTRHQQLLVAYQHAWTAYWWHEDFEEYCNLYLKAEELCKMSVDAHELELLSNLWINLHVVRAVFNVDRSKEWFLDRDSILEQALHKAANQPSRPNSSLHAELILVIHEFIKRGRTNAQETFSQLESILDRSTGLLGFPLDAITMLIEELEDTFDGTPEFESLFEKIVSFSANNASECEAGTILLRRGATHCNSERFYSAIRLLGKSLTLLSRKENLSELCFALRAIAHAYESIGLHWAARGSLITAASLASKEIFRDEDLRGDYIDSTSRIKWCELKLGRLPQALEWGWMDTALKTQFTTSDENLRKHQSEFMNFDLILGMLLLRANKDQLQKITRLPKTLENLDLQCGLGTLLFLLGHEQQFLQIIGLEDLDPEDFFQKLWEQPACEEVSQTLELGDGPVISLHTKVWGCKLHMHVPANAQCIQFGESTLAAFEALLATAGTNGAVGFEPSIQINVKQVTSHNILFKHIDNHELLEFELHLPFFAPDSLTKEDQFRLRDELSKFLIEIFLRAYQVSDLEDFGEKIFGDERAIARAIDFTSSIVSLDSILGPDAKWDIRQYFSDQDPIYPLLRSTMWVANNHDPQDDTQDKTQNIDYAAENMHQANFEAVSLIRTNLWDKARWLGCGFGFDYNLQDPPILGLIFENPTVGRQIFDGWYKKLGGIDHEEELRISILRGIRQDNPHAYRVSLTSNPTNTIGKTKFFSLATRNHTMEPTNANNIDLFLAAKNKIGSYFVVLAELNRSENSLKMMMDTAILKKQLVVKEAWEVGRHDLEIVALSPSDDPIIPAGKTSQISEIMKLVRSKS
jgi:tetratricopeptide (TPR) repeat protein